MKNTIGRFFIVNPTHILLRSPETVLARLSMRESPPPKGFILVLDVFPEERWLLASLLYTITAIERAIHYESPREKQNEKTDKS